MPERLCTVTDEYGQRHTIEVLASSVNYAAIAFFAHARTRAAEKLPDPGDGTVYEVQRVGETTVYRAEHRRQMTWAKRVAEQQWQRTTR